MRLALTLICLAVPAAALAAGDRYGPGEEQGSGPAMAEPAASPAPYAGRVLQWPGKTGRFARLVAPAPPPAPPPVAAIPMPIVPLASLYRPPQPPAAARAWVAPPPPVLAPPAPVALAAPAPRLPPEPPAPPQARVAMAQPPAAGVVRSHFYSLHREYGDAPDAIVVPIDRPPVLIGPADGAPQIGDDGEDQDPKPKHPTDSDGIY